MHMVKGLGNIWPWKFKDQGHCQGQTWWPHLRPRVQLICLLFFSWQSDHFGLRYSKLHIWPWKIKVKVMAKVKPAGHTWGLSSINMFAFHFMKIGSYQILCLNMKIQGQGHGQAQTWWSHLRPQFNRYVCFLFCGNQTIFGWDIENSIFDLVNQGQGHNKNQPKSNQIIYRSGPTIVSTMKEIQKVVQKLLRGQKSAAGSSTIRTGTKTQSHPWYTGVTCNAWQLLRTDMWFTSDVIEEMPLSHNEFLQNIHNKHPIACLCGWDMGCLLWVQSLVYILSLWPHSCFQYCEKSSVI